MNPGLLSRNLLFPHRFQEFVPLLRQIANAIERLLSDQNLADTLWTLALERAKYFDSRRMAEDHIKLYTTLVK
jgi:glycosyltransferase involved in cell wall biosynthesis